MAVTVKELYEAAKAMEATTVMRFTDEDGRLVGAVVAIVGEHTGGLLDRLDLGAWATPIPIIDDDPR